MSDEKIDEIVKTLPVSVLAVMSDVQADGIEDPVPFDEIAPYNSCTLGQWRNLFVSFPYFLNVNHDESIGLPVPASYREKIMGHDVIINTDRHTESVDEETGKNYLVTWCGDKAKADGKRFILPTEGYNENNPISKKAIEILNSNKTSDDIIKDMIDALECRDTEGSRFWDGYISSCKDQMKSLLSESILTDLRKQSDAAVVRAYNNKGIGSDKIPKEKYEDTYRRAVERYTVELIKGDILNVRKDAYVENIYAYLDNCARGSYQCDDAGRKQFIFIASETTAGKALEIKKAREEGALFLPLPYNRGADTEKFGLNLNYDYGLESGGAYYRRKIDRDLFVQDGTIKFLGEKEAVTEQEFAENYGNKINAYWASIIAGEDGRSGYLGAYKTGDKMPVCYIRVGLAHLYSSKDGKLVGLDERLEQLAVNEVTISSSKGVMPEGIEIKEPDGIKVTQGFATNYNFFYQERAEKSRN